MSFERDDLACEEILIMDHSILDFDFCDYTDCSQEVRKTLQNLLSHQNRKNVNVKFPWDDFQVKDDKQDENGNSINQPQLQVSCHQPVAFHMAPGVIVQPNLVQMPVVSDSMSVPPNGLPHLYAAPPFIGYQTLNLPEHVLSQQIPFAPLSAGGHTQQTLTNESTNNLSRSNELDHVKQPMEVIVTQSNMHPLPLSTIHQPFNTQSSAQPLFYPAGPPPAPRGPLMYISVPYGPPAPASYHVQQTPTGTMSVVPCAIASENVEVMHPDHSLTFEADSSCDKDEGFVCDDDVNTENNEIIESNENCELYNESGAISWTNEENCDNSVAENDDLNDSNDKTVISQDVEPDVENSCSESQIPVDQNIQENAWSKPKSWASLFTKNPNGDAPVNPANSIVQETGIETNGVKSDDELENFVSRGDDKLAAKIGGALCRFQIDSKSVHILPRGLVNKSNWCYINATLQALLVCPPFYNLLKELPIVPGHKRKCSSTPILDNIMEFVENFMSVQLNYNKNKRKEELSKGQPFEPNGVYKMLSGIGSSCVKGRQEDAEEFLSCILDGLHEEMLAVMKAFNSRQNSLENSITNGGITPNGDLEIKVNGASSDEDWLVIKGKNKGIITRSANYTKSPVSDIFGGQLRSVLKKSGTDPSANLEPFFTLQLDVQSNQICSVKDALSSLVSKESVEGCICAKTGAEVEASRRLTLEELPHVLILHIKRFVYNKDGGCQKILKQVEYDIDLELSQELLSSEVRTKYRKTRSYKLFAVVYHDGKEAVKGHYITDAYHSGSNGWLRFDDSSVHRISEGQVLKHCPPRVPYLLFYKRQIYYK